MNQMPCQACRNTDRPCPCGQVEIDDPQDMMNVVAAGDACESECDNLDMPFDSNLATACVPFQTYRMGFCPAEALAKGTLFPELISPYQRGC